MRIDERSMGRVKKRKDGYWLVNMPEGLFEDNEMGPYSTLEDLRSDRAGVMRVLQDLEEDSLKDPVRNKIKERRHKHEPVDNRQKGKVLL